MLAEVSVCDRWQSKISQRCLATSERRTVSERSRTNFERPRTHPIGKDYLLVHNVGTHRRIVTGDGHRSLLSMPYESASQLNHRSRTASEEVVSIEAFSIPILSETDQAAAYGQSNIKR